MKPLNTNRIKKLPPPEQIFLDRIKSLIKNLLIDNHNYNTPYYHSKYNSGMDYYKLLEDTKERANYILEEIDRIDHLIKDNIFK